MKATFWTPGRVIATVAVAVLIAVGGYTLFTGGASVSPEARLALPGTPAAGAGHLAVPPDFSVPTLDGQTFKLSDYRGKVVVLDFWATWCPPCREEVPQLVRLAEQNRARGLEIIGLHIDDQGRSSPEAINTFVRQFSVNYTVGRASNEMFVAYLGREETAIPQTVVFDRQGRQVAHFVGYTGSHAKDLETAINRALAGS